jgi:hypothetical protein
MTVEEFKAFVKQVSDDFYKDFGLTVQDDPDAWAAAELEDRLLTALDEKEQKEKLA